MNHDLKVVRFYISRLLFAQLGRTKFELNRDSTTTSHCLFLKNFTFFKENGGKYLNELKYKVNLNLEYYLNVNHC
jgi:hypothetical protein